MLVALAWLAPAAVASPPVAPGRDAALAFNCHTCHGPDARGSGDVPALTGLAVGEIAAKLKAFRAGEGTPTIMNRIARGYGDDDIARLAAWFGRRP